MDITFIDETEHVSDEKIQEIDGVLQFAADYLELPKDTEMSVTFMDNAAIQVINRDYRVRLIVDDIRYPML